MADVEKSTNGPETSEKAAWDAKNLPDYDNDFIKEEDFEEFAKALAVPDVSPSEEDLTNPKQPTEFITALNDWRPVHQRAKGWRSTKSRRKGKTRKPARRGKDEYREGWTYKVLKWPLLLVVTTWILGLSALYLMTRLYIYLYEHLFSWRGARERLRKTLRSRTNYGDWIVAAKALDEYLGSDKWREEDEYAYYDSKTIRRVTERLHNLRLKAEAEQKRVSDGSATSVGASAIEELRTLVEACVKNNFAGYENPRLYSETYYGTKNLVQSFVDESALAVELLFGSDHFNVEEKRRLAKHLSTNLGRTALCLSGGATFAYYHFGLAKALLDADLLPSIITGTSGGALVAALLATRTNDELKKLLVPALASRINACHDPFTVWFRRWYATGARFDSVDWAKRCAWFCHGSLTFAEAYERTGRILNVSCVPSDPHSPTILANYLTAPDCVIWSAVLASAAVPGILNPVVLMRKRKDGSLEPFSFGHKWKDGSLRTDIPLKSLNLHFNVNFSVVSQVNPHINLFFFSSRGTVGRPVTHRRGRGWRGGFMGSALEQYLKLDLTKWLKVLRHLELLPRWMGQDWSEIWLQRFSGTITIWPKSIMSDFYYILSDPNMERLARMINVGQHAAFPKLNFIGNRMKIEKVIEKARIDTRPKDTTALPTPALSRDTIRNMLSDKDLRELLARDSVTEQSEEAPQIPELMVSGERYQANTTRGRRDPPFPFSNVSVPRRSSPKKSESNSNRKTGGYFSSEEEADFASPLPTTHGGISQRRRLLPKSKNSNSNQSQNMSPTTSPDEKGPHKRSGSLSRRLGNWLGSLGSGSGNNSGATSPASALRSPTASTMTMTSLLPNAAAANGSSSYNSNAAGATGSFFDFDSAWAAAAAHEANGNPHHARASLDTLRPGSSGTSATARRVHGSRDLGRPVGGSSVGVMAGGGGRRRTSFVGEMARQSRVFFDDSETEGDTTDADGDAHGTGRDRGGDTTGGEETGDETEDVFTADESAVEDGEVDAGLLSSSDER